MLHLGCCSSPRSASESLQFIRNKSKSNLYQQVSISKTQELYAEVDTYPVGCFNQHSKHQSNMWNLFKLAIKTSEWRHWRHSSVSTVNFEHISNIVSVFPLNVGWIKAIFCNCPDTRRRMFCTVELNFIFFKKLKWRHFEKIVFVNRSSCFKICNI